MAGRHLLRAALIGLFLAGCSGGTPRTSSSESVIPASLAGTPAKQLFGGVAEGSSQRAASLGSYSKGCLAGAARLPESGPTWQAMRLSRNRNWAHPDLVAYLRELSAKAARQPGWSGLYIGDLSQPRGGPMLTGHASHQTGLDADIWMLPPDRLDLDTATRESLSSISTRRANGAFVNSRWTPQHHEILKAAASDPRIARIFVFPGAKVRMCQDETGDRDWLRKIRPWWGHHYHFHVRLSCPSGLDGCVNQAPPPPGDGCDDARQWVANILDPPPPDPDARPPKPKRDLTLTDLPNQCVSVLQSR